MVFAASLWCSASSVFVLIEIAVFLRIDGSFKNP
jgi:hypothetical protein